MAEGGEIRAVAKGIADDVAKGMEDSTAATEKVTTEAADKIADSVAEHQANDSNVRDKLRASATRQPLDAASADAASSGENSANSIGLSREQYVAQMTGGQLARGPDGQDIKIVMPNVGASGIDVIGPNGEYIFVGGPAKAADPSKFGKALKVSKYAADQAGVDAIYYLAEGTPDTAVKQAKRVFGENNVRIFKMGDS
jgi:hypothetical protein